MNGEILELSARQQKKLSKTDLHRKIDLLASHIKKLEEEKEKAFYWGTLKGGGDAQLICTIPLKIIVEAKELKRLIRVWLEQNGCDPTDLD